MARGRALCVTAVWLSAIALPVAAQPASTHALHFEGQKRVYQLLVPTQAASNPVPLIVLLHGRGGNGQRPLTAWQDLARKEGIALVAPNSLGEGWTIAADGPGFFHALIEAVKREASIDDRRVYLFGHSSGGHQALTMGPLESEYFAALAVHAGGINPSERVFLQEARRKIPVGMWHGQADTVVPIQFARDTRDLFKSLDFPIALNEITSHTHDYFSRASRINNEVWEFLKAHALTTDPLFRPYTFKR
jgi:phospholipase/carboxylesterase